MHFSVLVLTEKPVTRATAGDLVEQALDPHREEFDEKADEFTGHWDWWQIGGRWTGVLDGYEPSDDPRNVKTCNLCSGTGRRPDADRFGEEWLKQTGGCNGCRGEGKATVWPTSFAAHDGDVQPVAALKTDELTTRICCVVTPDGEWHGSLLSDDPLDVAGLLADHETAHAVIVDCHS